MTSPITPEERASAAWASLGDRIPTNGQILALIASAIRQAEDAAIERAAAAILDESHEAYAELSSPSPSECAEIIRTLKSGR